MSKKQLDTVTYSPDYYLQENVNTKHYGNVLLTSEQRMKGNIDIDLTFKTGTVSTPTLTYTVSRIDNYNYILITPTVQTTEGWINGTVNGTLAIPVSNVVTLETPTVISNSFTQTYTASTGKYIDKVVVNDIDRQSVNITPTKATQTVNSRFPEQYYAGSLINQVNIESIPEQFTLPTGITYVYNICENPTTWGAIIWTRESISASNIEGECIWKDLEGNTYLSYNGDNAILDETNLIWRSISWGGGSFTQTMLGLYIWSDGIDIYYSNGSTQKKLSKTVPNFWEDKTWNGLTNFIGSAIWTDGENIYYSSTKILNKETSTWENKSWTNLPDNFSSNYIWTDGENIYYSNGTSYQFELNKETSTWESKTWGGTNNINGHYIWTDNINIYYSRSASEQKILDKKTSTWNNFTWSGNITIKNGFKVWKTIDNIYYSDGSNSEQYTLNLSNTYLNNVKNYKYAYVQTENLYVTPTLTAQTFTPTSGKLIKQVTVEAAQSGVTGNTVVSQQYGYNVEEYATADVVSGSITYSGGSSSSTYLLDFTPTKFRCYIETNNGWINTGMIRVQKDANLVAGNILKGVTIAGITGTYEGSTPTYNGSYS